jgi:TetR/AcrR family transcriptional regulator, transcriptional repressor for nem operon
MPKPLPKKSTVKPSARRPAGAKPPARKGREQSKQETRDALIATGMTLFAKEGLDGPSLDALCEHAGFTRGAFYVHFRDRDDFLVAVMDRVGTQLLDRLLAPTEGGLPRLMERFLEAGRTGEYPLMPSGGIRPYQLFDACARSPLLRDRYLSFIRISVARVADFIRDGQERGMLRKDLHGQRSATLVLASILGAQALLDLGAPMAIEELGLELLSLFSVPED